MYIRIYVSRSYGTIGRMQVLVAFRVCHSWATVVFIRWRLWQHASQWSALYEYKFNMTRAALEIISANPSWFRACLPLAFGSNKPRCNELPKQLSAVKCLQFEPFGRFHVLVTCTTIVLVRSLCSPRQRHESCTVIEQTHCDSHNPVTKYPNVWSF